MDEQKQPGSHFHLFPSLPHELQDHIWSLAVRPLSGNNHAHSFYLADHYVDKAIVNHKYQADSLDLTRGNQGWDLAIPRDIPTREPNHSAYLLDSGLWRACRQSRKALVKHFHSNKYWPAELKSNLCSSPSAQKGDEQGKPTSSVTPNAHTAAYIDAAGEKQYITICPQTDLVHILDPVELYWFHQYAGDVVPIFDAPARGWGAGQDGPGFVGQNVGLDFEPEWAEGIEGGVCDMLDVLYTDAERTLWFIDYRLKRRAGLTAADSAESKDADAGSDSQGMVFYAWGYKFTEVKREQLGLWELDTPGSGKTAFDFFDRFERDTNGRLEVDDPSRLRVLARECSKSV